MKTLKTALAAWLILSCAQFAQMSFGQASFKPLGSLPGATFGNNEPFMAHASSVASISADGTIVVGTARSLGDDRHQQQVIVSTAGGPLQTLADLGSIVGAVSGDGSVIGGGIADPATGHYRAATWAADGTPRDLGGLGGRGGIAYGVSSDGSWVVGVDSVPKANDLTDFKSVAFHWNETAGMEQLPVPSNALSSGAYSISHAGWTLGKYSIARELRENEYVSHGNLVYESRPVIWDQDEKLIDLVPTYGGEFEDFRLVETSSDGDRLLGWNFGGFLWSETDGMFEIPGMNIPFAMTPDASVVVGRCCGSAGSYWSGDGALMWSEEHGTRRVQDVLGEMGVGDALDGWFLFQASAISDDGRTIAGSGFNPDGFVEGWVATVPEPGAPSALLLGVMCFAVFARRRAAQR